MPATQAQPEAGPPHAIALTSGQGGLKWKDAGDIVDGLEGQAMRAKKRMTVVLAILLLASSTGRGGTGLRGVPVPRIDGPWWPVAGIFFDDT